MPRQKHAVTIGDLDASTGARVDGRAGTVAFGDVELSFAGDLSKQEIAGALRRLADRVDGPRVVPDPSTGVQVGPNQWAVTS